MSWSSMTKTSSSAEASRPDLRSVSMLVIGEGLKPDDRVIVEGILQAIPGRVVKPQQAEKLSPSAESKKSPE